MDPSRTSEEARAGQEAHTGQEVHTGQEARAGQKARADQEIPGMARHTPGTTATSVTTVTTATTITPGPHHGLSASRRWLLLLMVSLGLLLVTVDITILLTALPVLTHDLHASATEGLWIVNAHPLFSTGLLLGAGTLGDRIGHRRTFLAGLLIFGLASLLAAFSGSVGMLVAARILQAVGASAMLPATLALIRVAFDGERERALAISIWAALSLVGAILGPLLGGWLLAHFHWGSLFLINVPVIALTFAGSWFVAPEHRTPDAAPWDLPSSVLALFALSSLVLVIKTLAHPPLDLAVLAAALGVGGAAAAAFVHRQHRLAHPLLDFSLFRNRAFAAGVLGAVSVTFTTGGVLLGVSQRFQWVAGYSPLESGLLASVLFVGTLPSSILGGLWAHRLGLRTLIAGGLALAAVGMLVAAQALPWHATPAHASLPAMTSEATDAVHSASQHGLVWLVGGLLLAGFGLGATISVASTAIVESAPPERAGMASSVEEVSYEFGALLAIAVQGSLLAGLYVAFIELPPGTDPAAGTGIATTLEWAARAGQAASQAATPTDLHQPAAEAASRAPALVRAAHVAFDRSYTVVMYVNALFLALGALLTGRLLNGRH